MSNVIIDKSKLDALANAISIKSGEPVTMTLREMVEAVDSIDTSGFTPTGNIDIIGAGTTDVTNYATATVPEGEVYVGFSEGYQTISGVKKWVAKPYAMIAVGDDLGTPGFIENDTTTYGDDVVMNAVPKNTSVTPTESAQTIGGSNYMMEGAVTVNAIPSNYVGSGITQRTSSDLSASGATVTAPAGYYASAATKTISSGSATASATKGTVSNHSITVTPSVTRIAGYITAGSANGTAVTVSASELVSGSQNITTNDTYDVTNLAEIVVNVSGGGGSSYTLTTIAPQQTVTSTSPPAGDQDLLLLTSSDGLVEGDYYLVTVNGTVRAQTAVRNNYVLYLADITDCWYDGNRTVLMASNSLYFCPWDAGSYTVKVEHLVLSSGGGGGSTLVEKSVTANGIYNASDDSADGYSKVTVSVSNTYTQSDEGKVVSSGSLVAQTARSSSITANGTYDTTLNNSVTVAVSGGSSKNTQTVQSTSRRSNTALGSIISLTCSTAGTYDVYWTCTRSNTSQTWGSQLYINGTAYGTENTTWSNNVQNNHLQNVSISANVTVEVYGRSRSGYYIYAPQLTIVQTA